eukprot:8720975-Ditylum_brightwellii.AAC.1
MDNYFTLPYVIAKLRDLSIGCVETARFHNGWPSKELRYVNQLGADFNNVFWSMDSFGTLVAQWVDNVMVFCISTVHRILKNNQA